MDLDPGTIKAVWGFNGTERPGAVYLAAVLAAHAQRGLPAFGIYGRDVQDAGSLDLPGDVSEKMLRFARAAVAAGEMRGKSYVNIGSVSMGISGSCIDPSFFQKYLGMRAEWVGMPEILRRIELGIYDHDECGKLLGWIKASCKAGPELNAKPHTDGQKASEWEFVAKMTLIVKDIMDGNPKLAEMGFHEEALGRSAIAAGFQGQRMWTDYWPNGDFTEAILNSTFDWSGKKKPKILATENDSLNAAAMLFVSLLTGRAPVFADVRTFWSPEAVKRVTGYTPEGYARDGLIHLTNSVAAALNATGAMKDAEGIPVMKQWWDVTDGDIKAAMDAVVFSPASLGYFRGGGFSSTFSTMGAMPVTLARINLIDGIGPVLQLAEGHTVELPADVNAALLNRTDPTWPSTWFAPRLAGSGAFADTHSVMANWRANHGAFVYGHIGADILTLALMLRIPVNMHNVEKSKIYRPHAWSAFGTEELESADYRACQVYGPLYK
jgi:L-fucose isomerase